MDAGIDFHGIDVLDPLLERHGDVDARPGADDQDVVRDGAHSLIDETVHGHGLESTLRRLHRLMRNPIHEQADGARRLPDQPNLVVGGPAIGRDDRLQPKEDEHDGQHRQLPDAAVPIDKQNQGGGNDHAPDNGWGSEEGQR